MSDTPVEGVFVIRGQKKIDGVELVRCFAIRYWKVGESQRIGSPFESAPLMKWHR